MANKFIQLTNNEDNTPITFNVNRILCFKSVTKKEKKESFLEPGIWEEKTINNGSVILLNDGGAIHVKESYEEIQEMVN